MKKGVGKNLKINFISLDPVSILDVIGPFLHLFFDFMVDPTVQCTV